MLNSSVLLAASVNDVLAGIHLVRATTQIEFLAFCHTIESWLSEHDKVGYYLRLQCSI
jgi:hypothetical protein